MVPVGKLGNHVPGLFWLIRYVVREESLVSYIPTHNLQSFWVTVVLSVSFVGEPKVQDTGLPSIWINHAHACMTETRLSSCVKPGNEPRNFKVHISQIL